MEFKFRLTRIMGFGIAGKGLLGKRILELGFVEKVFGKRIWDCGIKDLGFVIRFLSSLDLYYRTLVVGFPV